MSRKIKKKKFYNNKYVLDLLMQVNSKMSSWLEMKKQMQTNDMENRQKLQQCQEQIAAVST